jgi:hypothetical protein
MTTGQYVHRRDAAVFPYQPCRPDQRQTGYLRRRLGQPPPFRPTGRFRQLPLRIINTRGLQTHEPIQLIGVLALVRFYLCLLHHSELIEPQRRMIRRCNMGAEIPGPRPKTLRTDHHQ